MTNKQTLEDLVKERILSEEMAAELLGGTEGTIKLQEITKLKKEQADKLIANIRGWNLLPKDFSLDKTKVRDFLIDNLNESEILNGIQNIIDIKLEQDKEKKEKMFLDFLYPFNFYMIEETMDISNKNLFGNEFIDTILNKFFEDQEKEYYRVGIFCKPDTWDSISELLSKIKNGKITKTEFSKQFDYICSEVVPLSREFVLDELKDLNGWDLVIKDNLIEEECIVKFIQAFPLRTKAVELLIKWINTKDIEESKKAFLDLIFSFDDDNRNDFYSMLEIVLNSTLNHNKKNKVVNNDFVLEIVDFLSCMPAYTSLNEFILGLKTIKDKDKLSIDDIETFMNDEWH